MFRCTRTALAAVALAWAAAGCGASVAPQIHSDADRLTLARRAYAAGQPLSASGLLETYVTTATGSADIDQAVHLLGLAYLAQKEYANAQAQFERMAREYPESDSALSASYHLGSALMGQSRGPDYDQEFTLKALAQWEQLVADAPESEWAEVARTRIAECRSRLARKLWRSGDVYLKIHLYEPAKVYFGDILRDYADTPLYGDAVIGNALADARLGRRDSALAVLSALAKEHEGRPLGRRAAEALARVHRWPAEGDVRRRRHRTVEPAQPAPVTPTPATTNPYGS